MLLKNFLDDACLDFINTRLNQHHNWSDGPLTGNTADKDFKNNKEYIGNDKSQLDNIILAKLNESIEWRSFIVAPKATSDILYLKYEKNDLYNYHADVAQGTGLGAIHFANSLVLSAPDEYEGGELVLTVNQEKINYKPEKNTLLTYPVGIKHLVQPIKAGTRKVAVFWTESFITDKKDRDTLRELNNIHHNLNECIKDKLNIEKASENPFLEILVDLTRLSESIHGKYPRFRDPRCHLISE